MDSMKHFTDQVAEQYRERLERFVKYKLDKLAFMALEQGEMELNAILTRIDMTDINKTSVELNRHGYVIEFELEKPDVKMTSEDTSFKATIGVSNIKIKVMKTILEV